MINQLSKMFTELSAAKPTSMKELNNVSSADIVVDVSHTTRGSNQDYTITIDCDGLQLVFTFSHRGRMANVYGGKLFFSHCTYTFCRGAGCFKVSGLTTNLVVVEAMLGKLINSIVGLAIKLEIKE